MVRPTTYSVSLTFKCQSTAIVLVRPQAVAGRILWNRVCPSSLLTPAWVFSWNESLDFSEFWHGARSPYAVFRDIPIFWKNFFCPKSWENGPKIGQKLGFLNLKKNVVINFHLLCSIMKIFIICCGHAQIPHLGKIFWDIGQNAFSQSDCRILRWTFFQSKSMKQPHF